MEMSNTIRNYQKIQIIVIIVAILLLFFGNFAGAYYSSSSKTRMRSQYDVSTGRYNPVYQTTHSNYFEPVRLGSGVIASIMILLGIVAFGYALNASIQSYKAETEDIASIVENIGKSINGAKFAVGLSIFGAVMFILNYSDATEWWLDSGFYGAFIGGLLAIYFGKKTIRLLE